MPETASPRRRGAPPGNLNHFKHGFYSTQFRRPVHSAPAPGSPPSDPSAALIEEVALIRLFTRRLVDTFELDSGYDAHADLLRTLCLASSAVIRVIRAQALISTAGLPLPEHVTEALNELNACLLTKILTTTSPPGSDPVAPTEGN